MALSDSAGVLATPYELLTRAGIPARDHERVAEMVRETEAELVVVGLPLSLDGSRGPAAQRVEAEVADLRQRVGVPVETWDERLSTVEAERRLRAAGIGGRQRRHLVDQVAATVILQSWLDSQPPQPEGPP